MHVPDCQQTSHNWQSCGALQAAQDPVVQLGQPASREILVLQVLPHPNYGQLCLELKLATNLAAGTCIDPALHLKGSKLLGPSKLERQIFLSTVATVDQVGIGSGMTRRCVHYGCNEK